MFTHTEQIFPALSAVAGALASNSEKRGGVQHSAVSLSARERTIVLLMGHGLTNKMIARQMSIAPETVKSHAKRIFWKLTVQTRAQAVYRASALGLLSHGDDISVRETFDLGGAFVDWLKPQLRAPISNPRLNVETNAPLHAA